MSRASWKKKILNGMIANGTYKESFLPVIETLADILDRRDMAMKEWKDGGCQITVVRTTDRGQKNASKNPVLTVIQECERDALTYWSNLGLTPSGLKKTFVTEKENAEKTVQGLGDILRSIANGDD